MLALPGRFLKFFFPSGLTFFVRTWVHTISLIEEDLAVGLMLRLLFVPLFHDSSLVGRGLSLIFRLTRVFIGVLAYAFASLLILCLLVFWFFSWGFLLFPNLRPWGFLYIAFVLVLFTWRLFYPQKIVKEVYGKSTKNLNLKEVWKTTKLKPKDITFQKLLKKHEVLQIIKSLEVTPEAFKNYNPSLSGDILLQTLQLAWRCEVRFITSDYFFISLLFSLPNIENDLLKLNLTLEDFEGALKFQEEKRRAWKKVFIWDEEFGVKHLKGVNRGWLGAPTPYLDSVSVDLTREAARVGFEEFLGRKDIVLEVVNVLSQTNGSNVLLVGSVGSGKKSLVNYLAKVIVAGDAPESFATKRLVSLELSSLLVGIRSEGELAERVKNIFDEVRSIGGIIIYLPEVQNLGIGEAGSSFNLYSLLLPEIESSGTQFLASTEPENYSRIVEKDVSFAGLFTKIEVPPATIPETMQILKDRAINLERYQNIAMTYIAVKTLANLSHDFIHERVLPDSALTILEECKVLAKGIIGSEVAKEVVGKRVNIPLEELNSDKKEELLNLEGIIHQRLIGQEEAVKVVSDTLRRSATELRDKNRPIGSFLFVGPTGVGKTELAKILADVYFAGSNRGPVGTPSQPNSGVFIRFDMSEYQTPEALERLLGTVENPGELTEAVKNKPYCLLLLDEFEKADPKILTLFLQVLDDGRLTDARGVTIDFTSTIIIATSNAASLLITQGLEKGQNMASLKQPVHEELLKVFKPELVNRFDEVVVFKPLSKIDLEEVVTIKLESFKGLMKEKGYLIEFSPELLIALAEKGFNPSLGARPLRRYIQDTLEAKLSTMMLEGTLKKGQPFLAGQEMLAG